MIIETTLYIFMGFQGVVEPSKHSTALECEQQAMQMIEAHRDYRKYIYVCVNDEGHEIFKFNKELEQ